MKRPEVIALLIGSIINLAIAVFAPMITGTLHNFNLVVSLEWFLLLTLICIWIWMMCGGVMLIRKRIMEKDRIKELTKDNYDKDKELEDIQAKHNRLRDGYSLLEAKYKSSCEGLDRATFGKMECEKEIQFLNEYIENLATLSTALRNILIRHGHEGETNNAFEESFKRRNVINKKYNKPEAARGKGN